MIVNGMAANAFVIALVMSLVIQIAFFLMAATAKTDKYTDLSYGSTFVIVALLLGLAAGGPIQLLNLAMVVLWGIRLSWFLYYRILKMKSDHRFDGIRENPWTFARFWLLQAISIWIILWPTIWILDYKKVMVTGPTTWIGVGMWLTGWLMEIFADIQKSAFRFNPANAGKFVNTGLWRYSRHPNYFGEMLCWWGIWVMALPYLKDWAWLSTAGPVYITYLLLYVTGIPPLEKRYNELYKDNPDYKEYKKNTSLLIPLPIKDRR